MTESLAALLANSLDYAGLFPPAALDMAKAVAEYDRYHADDPIGMLAGFVCPAARMHELARRAGHKYWNLAVLGTAAESTSGSLERLVEDARRIDSFLNENRGFSMSALELRVPSSLLGTPTELEAFLSRVEEVVSQTRYAPGKIFYDLGWSTPWNAALRVLKQGKMFRGAKVRTGGLTAAAFPSSEQVAAFLLEAGETRVPWKATAGLHHPVRRFQREVEATMHGFLNVFLAAALAWKGSDEATLIDLLNEEDASAFRFEDERVSWRDHVLDRELILSTRSEFAQSFGSCSYQEPIDDLKALGLL